MGMFKAPLLCERNNGGLKFAQEYHGADEEQKKQWYELNSSLIEKGKSAAVTSKQRWMNFFDLVNISKLTFYYGGFWSIHFILLSPL